MEKTLAGELKAKGYKKLHNTGSGSWKWEKVFVRDKDSSLRIVVLASKKETKATCFNMFEGVQLSKMNKDVLKSGWYAHYQDLRTPETSQEELEKFFRELDSFVDEHLNDHDNEWYKHLREQLLGEKPEISNKKNELSKKTNVEKQEDETPSKDESEELTSAIETIVEKE